MATTNNPTDVPLVSCDVCLKEVPISEAVVAEATDYVVHFCGLECYQRWKSPRDASRPQDGESAS